MNTTVHVKNESMGQWNVGHGHKMILQCLYELGFYGLINTVNMLSPSVKLSHFLGRHSPLSGKLVLCAHASTSNR